MYEVFCGGTLASCAEEAMAADAVIAEAGSMFLQQHLHLFIGLGRLIRRMLVGPSAVWEASVF